MSRCGTRSGYAAGCRCDACREAHRVYNRETSQSRLSGKARRMTHTPPGYTATVDQLAATIRDMYDANGIPLSDEHTRRVIILTCRYLIDVDRQPSGYALIAHEGIQKALEAFQ